MGKSLKEDIKFGLHLAGSVAGAVAVVPLTVLTGLAFLGGTAAKKYAYDIPRVKISKFLNPLTPNTSRVLFERNDSNIHIHKINGKEILIQNSEEACGPYGIGRTPITIVHGEIKRYGECYTQLPFFGSYDTIRYFDVSPTDDCTKDLLSRV